MNFRGFKSNRGSTELLIFVMISLLVVAVGASSLFSQSRRNASMVSALDELEGFYMSDVGASVSRAGEPRVIPTTPSPTPSFTPSPTPTFTPSPTPSTTPPVS